MPDAVLPPEGLRRTLQGLVRQSHPDGRVALHLLLCDMHDLMMHVARDPWCVREAIGADG